MPQMPRRYGSPVRSSVYRQITELEDYVRDRWSCMLDNCVPIRVALELLDNSSLGRAGEYDDFVDTMGRIEETLRGIVNDHYEEFTNALGTYDNASASLKRSVDHADSIVRGLEDAQAMLAGTPESKLSAMQDTSREHMQALLLLRRIDALRTIPDQVELLLGEKKFHVATELLHSALADLEDPELRDIGSLQGIAYYLKSQQATVKEILLDELHNHLYLKTPYCDARWKTEFPNSADTVVTSTLSRAASNASDGTHVSLSGRDDETYHEVESIAQANPEADSLRYIRSLIESMNSLNDLKRVIHMIYQRLPTEVYQLVDKTIGDIAEMHGLQTWENSSMAALLVKKSSLYEEPMFTLALEELVRVLFAKLKAVLQGHLVVHDCITRINRAAATAMPSSDSNGASDSNGTSASFALAYDLMEIWMPIQNEITSMFRDYVVEESRFKPDQPVLDNNVSVGDLFNFRRNRIERSGRPFRFNDFDATISDMKDMEDEISEKLRRVAPGLTNYDPQQDYIGSLSQQNPSEKASERDRMSVGHRMLAAPSLFNLPILLKPTLSFTTDLERLVLRGSSISVGGFSSFLDTFISGIFFQQLRESMDEQFERIFGAEDCWSYDEGWSPIASFPVCKCGLDAIRFIDRTVSLLRHVPYGEEEQYNMVLDMLGKILGQLTQHFKDAIGVSVETMATSKGSSKALPTLANEVAQSPTYKSIVQSIVTSIGLRKQDTVSGLEKEMEYLASFQSRANEIQGVEDSREEVELPAVLCTTVGLFIEVIFDNTRPPDMSGTPAVSTYPTRRQSVLNLRGLRTLATSKEQYQLREFLRTSKLAPQLKDLRGLFDSLRQEIIRTLRASLFLNIGSQIEHYSRVNFALEHSEYDLQPNTLEINRYLLQFQDYIESNLPKDEKEIISFGLSTYMNELLIKMAPKISKMNSHGAIYFSRNIRAIEQNLRNLVSHPEDADFSRSIGYYGFAAQDFDVTLAYLREHPDLREANYYTFDQMRDIFNLKQSTLLRQTSTARASGGGVGARSSTASTSDGLGGFQRDSSVPARRLLNEALIDLNELYAVY